MKITKIGHCCLLVEIRGVRLLTDPGAFSVGQNEVSNIDTVLITHEHADHCHIPSLQAIITNNPEVVIYANQSTGLLLEKEDINYTLITEGSILDVKGVKVQTWNCEHADIFKEMTPVLNTALFVENTLLFPGDAFYCPSVPVDTLALPVSAPWCKSSEVIEYARTIKPRQCFPVHDAVLNEHNGAPYHAIAKRFIESEGISYLDLKEGETIELH